MTSIQDLYRPNHRQHASTYSQTQYTCRKESENLNDRITDHARLSVFLSVPYELVARQKVCVHSWADGCFSR